MENKKLSSLEYKEMMAQKERVANSELSQAVFGKLPPQSIEIEEVVLGACLIDCNGYAKIANVLQPIYFYKEANQAVYRAITALSVAYKSIDRLTVFEQMQKDDTLDKIGGNPYYLTQLTEGVASSAHIESHARLIQQKYILREMINISTGTITDAYSGQKDVFQILGTHQQKWFELTQFGAKKQVADAVELGDDLLRHLQMQRDSDGDLTGVTSGMQVLDELTGGWQDSDLIIIGARPSMGKSAFANSLVVNAAKANIPTIFFSLEMSKTQVTSRMVANHANIPLDNLTKNIKKLSSDEFAFVVDAISDFKQLPVFVDDSSGIPMTEIASKMREMVQRHGAKMGIVDYLGLIKSSGKSGNREQEVSELAANLKALAKELSIPIVLLVQLNRNLENRPNKRPQLSDIRESGGVEQHADIVGFIHRPEYYGITEYDDGSSTKGCAEIIIAKQRNGAIGDVRLKFDGSKQRFWDESNETLTDFESELHNTVKITPQDNQISTERLIFDSDYSPF